MDINNLVGFIVDTETCEIIEVNYWAYIEKFVRDRINRTYFVVEIDTKFIVVEIYKGIPDGVSDFLCTRCEAERERFRLLERDYHECNDLYDIDHEPIFPDEQSAQVYANFWK